MNYLQDFATSTVATAPSPATSGTSLVVATGEGALFPPVPFFATLCPDNTLPTIANAEKVKVTAVSTDTLTIVRAQGATTAKTVANGWRISNAVYAADIPIVGTRPTWRYDVYAPNFALNTLLASNTMTATGNNGVFLDTGSTSGDQASIIVANQSAPQDPLSSADAWKVGQAAYWKTKFLYSIFNNAGYTKVSVGDSPTETGQTHNSNGSYGFYADCGAGKVYAFAYDGTTETRVDITASTVSGGTLDTTPALISAVYTPGVSVQYYINSALVATITSHIPLASGTWNGNIGGNAITNSGGNTQRISLYMFGIAVNLY